VKLFFVGVTLEVRLKILLRPSAATAVMVSVLLEIFVKKSHIVIEDIA
jgi:hypothetical protein